MHASQNRVFFGEILCVFRYAVCILSSAFVQFCRYAAALVWCKSRPSSVALPVTHIIDAGP